MDISKNITINLSENDIKEIIQEYLNKKGYRVEIDDIKFSVSQELHGYYQSEHEEAVFKGCIIQHKSIE